MIIVRRCPTNVNKLQRNIQSISSSTMSTPSHIRGGTSAGAGTGGDQVQGQTFDWGSVLTPENKANTIQLLTIDRENFGFVFPEDDPSFRKAAVLVPLCYDIKGRLSLLYNLRSSNLNKHKGEISFPGGSMDPEDKDDPVLAALRETKEELGISSDDIDIWTTARVFPTISTQMVVIPVLGYVKNGPVDCSKLNVNPDEVEHAFTVTLDHLCDKRNWDENKGSKFRGRDFIMPLWKNLKVFNGSQEEVHLWGLTAFVTHVALSALLPAAVYTRKIAYSAPKTKKEQESSKTSGGAISDCNSSKPNSNL